MLRSIILSCGWDVFRLAMACKFFGGLTNMRSAGDGLAQNRLAMARNGGGLQV